MEPTPGLVEVLQQKHAEGPKGVPEILADVPRYALEIASGAAAIGLTGERATALLSGYPEGVRAVLRPAARSLVTLGPEHAVWSRPAKLEVSGALVRLFPPAHASDGDVRAVEELLRLSGAQAVRTMPRPTLDKPVTVAAEPAPPRRTIREAVQALLGQAITADREALGKLVDEALDQGERFSPPAVRVQTGAPLFLSHLIVENWARYRGEQDLLLGEDVYGLTARTPGDPARSNWQGKSTLVEALPFAFFGVHRWARDDDWITAGEEEGRVEVALSDGTFIERARRRGKSTQLRLVHDGREYRQDAAQQKIEELIGLSKDDFFATCFFEQKALARLIKAKPAELLAIVRGWLELDALVHAETWAKEQLSLHLAEQADEEQRVVRVRERRTQILKSWGVESEADPAAVLTAKKAERDAENAAQRQRARELEHQQAAAVASLDGWKRDASIARKAAWNRNEIERLKTLCALIDVDALRARLPGLKQAADEAFAAHQVAVNEGKSKLELARGRFDGACPVAACPCPIAEQINADRERNAALAKAAQDAVLPALRALQDARAKRDDVERQIEQAASLSRKIGELEAQLVGTDAAVKRIARDGQPPEEATGPTPDDAWELAVKAERVSRDLRDAINSIGELTKEEEQRRKQAATAGAKAMTAREAVVLLGKGGAQKAIAVAELGEIERGANALLAANGIELSLSVRWGRESTTVLATSCETCGAAFPSSQKVKACTRCGATRGPKVDDKLELTLSDRSGAAEDLAGLALQLAASSWLRDRRGARWATVVLDEPFGALDPVHSRALATHLAGMIRGRSFRQGFVIAHSAGVMDTLPGRIQVTGGPEGSTVEVFG